MKIYIVLIILILSVPSRASAVSDRKAEAQRMREEFSKIVSTRAGDIREKMKKHTIVQNAIITAIDGTDLTVESDGSMYRVDISEQTRLRRHYFGKSSIDEFAVGQKVMIVGVYTDDAKTRIEAKYIRNLSIMKRFGVFIGTVSAISGKQITLDTVARGVQSATVSDATKFVNRMTEPISLSDISVGHRIRIKGLWDKENKTITDVLQIKDFSLPVRKAQ